MAVHSVAEPLPYALDISLPLTGTHHKDHMLMQRISSDIVMATADQLIAAINTTFYLIVAS